MIKKKKKILLLSDHALSTSGVGTQARWLINGLVETGKYSFFCFGGAISHESYDIINVNPDFIIKPTKGFGDKSLLRTVLAQIKPDALMLFTDPRFFVWVWEMADEINQICPIVYWHLWDNPPVPKFNDVLYESTQAINCINWPTYEMLKERFPQPGKVGYIPHGVPDALYKPIPDDEILKFRKELLGKDKFDDFIALYVGRNARRKCVSDILMSWKMFVQELEQKYGHKKATLILHTDPLDPEGPNLHHVVEMLGIENNIVFSKDRTGFNEMRTIYNVSDVIINSSSNEGFGLPVLEGKMCGIPSIAIKTGGLTRQIVDHETGEEYGVAMTPDVRTIVGNQSIPYIFEDYVSHETRTQAFMKMYEMGSEKRKELGKRALTHAQKHYNLSTVISDWDKSLEKTCNDWELSPEKKWSLVEV
jgi:glycosyltransferase involved in cell wall biosynthesis